MISVKERMPADGTYLVYRPVPGYPDIGSFHVLTICGGHWNTLRDLDGSIDCSHEITGISHWMPLPEEPKGDD